jgi:HD-GYP domain-containing protein (c-di-GMP phosphodiesterase class II)
VVAAVEAEREPVEHEGQRYLPVSIESIRVNSIPPFDLYLQAGSAPPIVLYCERNTLFTGKARRQLENNGVTLLYVRSDNRSAYNSYLADNLEKILKDTSLTVKKKAVILYDCAQAVVEDVLARPRSREGIDRGKTVMRQTVDFMTSDDFMLEHLLRTISCDYYLYTHSVNVVAYTVALALEAGYHDRALLRELANGALLHDIGKSAIPSAVLNKPGLLTPEEREQVEEHPRIGYQLLIEQAAVGEIALDIVLHHHERIDGGGYPERLRADRISPFVQMAAIADVFDALTTDRFHQKGRSTFEALSTMLKEMSDELDPELVRAFVEMMGSPTRP